MGPDTPTSPRPEFLRAWYFLRDQKHPTELYKLETDSMDDIVQALDVGTITNVSFDMQYGTVSEVGVNGLQVDDLVKLTKYIVERRCACSKNQQVVGKLKEVMDLLASRTSDRISRGVEGTNKE